jgi:hypothetical protein
MKNYFKHLAANWKVSFLCLVRCIFHFLHGLFPCKYTSHDYWKV